MATLDELKMGVGDIIGIAGENGDIHNATVLGVNDYRDRPDMIPGVIYLAPPRPDAPKTWVYYRNSKTFREDDGTAPDYQDKIIVEAVSIIFNGFVAVAGEQAVL